MRNYFSRNPRVAIPVFARHLRALWKIFALSMALLVLAGGLGYRAYDARHRAGALLALREVEKAPLNALEQVVSLRFAREVTMREWCDEFTRQTGMDVEVNPSHYTELHEHGGAFIVDKLTDETPIRFQLPPLPAREALETIGQWTRVKWRLRDNKTIVFGDHAYLLPGQLVRTLEQGLHKADGDGAAYYPNPPFLGSGSAYVYLHIGNLLKLDAYPEQPARTIVEDTLRRLRTGELQPLPKKPGDERYYHRPYSPIIPASPLPLMGM